MRNSSSTFNKIRNGFIGSSEHTVSMNLPHPPTQTYTKLAGNISRQQLHLVLPVALYGILHVYVFPPFSRFVWS